jgi:hypothetical protein
VFALPRPRFVEEVDIDVGSEFYCQALTFCGPLFNNLTAFAHGGRRSMRPDGRGRTRSDHKRKEILASCACLLAVSLPRSACELIDSASR